MDSYKKIVVTSTHDWHKNTKLELYYDNNKLVLRKWYFNNKLYEFSSSIEDFVKEFDRIYTLFGVPCDVKIDNGNIDLVFESIYSLPIPNNLKFVCIDTCGCNMGHCTAALSIDILEFNTVKDILKYFATPVETDNGIRYEYPDSVFLYLDIIEKLPEVHIGKSCYKEKVKSDIVMDKKYTYVSIYYSR